MLVLDRSGSMSSSSIASLKNGAHKFIDIIDESSDGQLDGVIANGSRVGIVSFATSATMDLGLTTDAIALKTAINFISAGGATNHEHAFQLAQGALSGSQPTNEKVMIMFTDGVTTTGGDPNNDAEAARAAGTEIFAIGLGSVSVTALNNWASDPDSDHVFITPSATDLDNIFQGIGAIIVTPAATNIQISGTVNSTFTVSNVSSTKGIAAQAGNIITWNIDSLGSEVATLTYTITHAGSQDGSFQVNDLITYSDDQGQLVTFDNPTVNISNCTIPASIDIKPHSDPNSYGSKSQGSIPVALIGSIDFDVTQVDDSTVLFGDAENSGTPPRKANLEDVNMDGILDKVYHFEFTETHLDPSDTTGYLSGIINGVNFLGSDSVNIR